MKKILSYRLLLCISLLILISCEDYLDKQPYDQISASTFWKTKEDFEMALTANYGLLQSMGTWSDLYPNWDNLTDNSFGQHNYSNTKAIVMGDINPLTGGYISEVYRNSYRGITRANIFLEKLGNYEGSDISEKDRKLYEGEIRFFRAFYYFQLYSLYGDVPLVTEPLTLENQEQPKVAADKIFDQIISDLDYAVANLNVVPYYIIITLGMSRNLLLKLSKRVYSFIKHMMSKGFPIKIFYHKSPSYVQKLFLYIH